MEPLEHVSGVTHRPVKGADEKTHSLQMLVEQMLTWRGSRGSLAALFPGCIVVESKLVGAS